MNETLKQANLSLMASQDIAYLSSLDQDGFPQIRAMMNLRSQNLFPQLTSMHEGHQDDFVTFLTTNMPSSKIKDLERNSKTSLYFCDTQGFHGLMLAGHVEIVLDKSVMDAFWQDDWIRYYPDGKDGKEYGILKMTPVFAKGWHQMAPFHHEFKAKS